MLAADRAPTCASAAAGAVETPADSSVIISSVSRRGRRDIRLPMDASFLKRWNSAGSGGSGTGTIGDHPGASHLARWVAVPSLRTDAPCDDLAMGVLSGP